MEVFSKRKSSNYSATEAKLKFQSLSNSLPKINTSKEQMTSRPKWKQLLRMWTLHTHRKNRKPVLSIRGNRRHKIKQTKSPPQSLKIMCHWCSIIKNYCLKRKNNKSWTSQKLSFANSVRATLKNRWSTECSKPF